MPQGGGRRSRRCTARRLPALYVSRGDRRRLVKGTLALFGGTALPDFGKISFPERQPLPWETVLTGPAAVSCVAARELCAALLSLNPSGRPTAAEALRHAYFFQRPLPDRTVAMPPDGQQSESEP